MAIGESFEGGGINEDETGGVERADEIFAFGEVDAGFAADGGVDLSDKGGGDLDERDAAEAGGSHESGYVTYDAATNGDEERVAIDAGAD